MCLLPVDAFGYISKCEVTGRDVLFRAGVDACSDGCHRNNA